MTVVVTIYVQSERFIYFWDSAIYHRLSTISTANFRAGPRTWLDWISCSFSNDYNGLFTLPLIPLELVLGDSRLVFIIGLALCYLLPLALALGALTTRLLGRGRLVFWSGVVVALLLPGLWVPTLQGIPDCGAAALLVWASVVYLDDSELQHWRSVVLIGALLAGAALFRRHFIYAEISFFAAALLQTFAEHARPERRGGLWPRLLRLGMIGLCATLCLAAVAPNFVAYLFSNNFAALYRSYTLPWTEVLGYYASEVGGMTLLLALTGFVCGWRAGLLDHRATAFVLTMGLCFLTVWVGLVRQSNPHYILHIVPPVALGLCALVWTLRLRLRVGWGWLGAGIGAIGSLCMLAALSPLGSAAPRPLLPAAHPPPTRDDYADLIRLIDYLRAEVPIDSALYVAASSRTLNDSIIAAAEQQRIPDPEQRHLILPHPHIDSRDYYPLESLLQTDFVIVAEPFLHHLAPEQQQVVQVVVDAFRENWPIATDFVRLPERFRLEHGTTVSIYRRSRPTTLETALSTFAYMRQQIGVRPGGQGDWLVLTGKGCAVTKRAEGDTYQLQLCRSQADGPQEASFLYIGALEGRPTLQGQLDTAPSCQPADLRFSALSDSMGVIGPGPQPASGGSDNTFLFQLPTQNARALLLTVADHCIGEIVIRSVRL